MDKKQDTVHKPARGVETKGTNNETTKKDTKNVSQKHDRGED